MLPNVVPVTVIVVAVGLSACRRACAAGLVVPPIPGMLTVVLDARRSLMSAPPCGSLPAVATEFPLMFRQTAFVSPARIPLSEWMPCSELIASAKFDTVLFVTCRVQRGTAFARFEHDAAVEVLPDLIVVDQRRVRTARTPRADDDAERLRRTRADDRRIANHVVLDRAAERAGAAALVDVDGAALAVPPERHCNGAVVRNVVGDRAVERRTE